MGFLQMISYGTGGGQLCFFVSLVFQPLKSTSWQIFEVCQAGTIFKKPDFENKKFLA